MNMIRSNKNYIEIKESTSKYIVSTILKSNNMSNELCIEFRLALFNESEDNLALQVLLRDGNAIEDFY